MNPTELATRIAYPALFAAADDLLESVVLANIDTRLTTPATITEALAA